MCHGTEGPGRLAGPKLARNIADIAEAASFILHSSAEDHDEHESAVAPNEPHEAQKIPFCVSDVMLCLDLLWMCLSKVEHVHSSSIRRPTALARQATCPTNACSAFH